MIKLLWDFSGELVHYVPRLKESLELALLLSIDGSDHFSTRERLRARQPMEAIKFVIRCRN